MMGLSLASEDGQFIARRAFASQRKWTIDFSTEEAAPAWLRAQQIDEILLTRTICSLYGQDFSDSEWLPWQPAMLL
jgi:hypothetical protein